MASKITPKNLSYDTSLPPFLQRLHSQNTSFSDGRHERPIARPRRARDPDAEADDEPTYVDESTNHTLSKEEYAELVGGGKEDANDGEKDGGQGRDVVEGEVGEKVVGAAEKEKVAAIGVGRKRKAGKVVGSGEDDDGGKEKPTSAHSGEKEEKISVEGTRKTGGPKKKGKKIKLSFNDEEEP